MYLEEPHPNPLLTKAPVTKGRELDYLGFPLTKAGLRGVFSS
jgi:hypothetical protein